MNGQNGKSYDECRTGFLKMTGKFIARKRKMKSMTQKDLADILKVDSSTVSKYEHGHEMPASTLAVISEACGFHLQEYVKAWRAVDLQDAVAEALKICDKRPKPACPTMDFTQRGYMTPISIPDTAIDMDEAEVIADNCTEQAADNMMAIYDITVNCNSQSLKHDLFQIAIEYCINSAENEKAKQRMMAYYNKLTGRNLSVE